MEWIYKDDFVEVLPENVFGFVYLLTFTDGTKYVGKKSCYSTVTLAPLKSGVPRDGAIRIKKRNKVRGQPLIELDQITKESKWKAYEGSSELTKDLVVKSKEILEYAPTYRSLTYLEVKYLFIHEVLERDEFHNANINNNWFKGNLL